jgi:hypothetical protein
MYQGRNGCRRVRSSNPDHYIHITIGVLEVLETVLAFPRELLTTHCK